MFDGIKEYYNIDDGYLAQYFLASMMIPKQDNSRINYSPPNYTDEMLNNARNDGYFIFL